VSQPPCRWTVWALAQRSLPGLSVNTVIALLLTAFGVGDFGVNLVYSHCIGVSIWLLIEAALNWLMPRPKQQSRRMYLLVPLCVVLGYGIGLYLAAAMLGHQLGWFGSGPPRLVLGYLLLSLLAGSALSYYFMSREQLASASEDMALASAQAEAAQRQAAESQLKLLQTQLEPHMLFNTLANLRALIAVNPIAATEMLDRLNAYLRATLSASRATTHSLQAEFERLRDYLELIAVRMGPRLQYSLELPPELAQCPVPTLLLQPLVENAIGHGLEPKVEGGRITVRARRALGQLTLEVQDSGVGLPPGNAATDGFGLAQVRERLASAYGERASFELHSGQAPGTLARITYPCPT
jgi:signal transduction histidine kinase